MPPPISRLLRKKLGALLIEEGVLKEDQLQEALRRQRTTGESLGDVLAVLGFLTEVDVARAVAKQFGLPYMDPTRYQVPKEALESVPVDLMRQNQFIVLDRIGRTLVLAVAGVLNGEVLEKVEKVSGCQAFVYVATPAQVQQALDKHLAPKAAKAAPKAAGPIPGRK